MAGDIFKVVNRKNQGKWVYAEMVAACDPQVRFWLNAKLLQDNSQWYAGWQTLQEINSIESDPKKPTKANNC